MQCDIEAAGCVASRKQPVSANLGRIDATLAQKCKLSTPQSRKDTIRGHSLVVQVGGAGWWCRVGRLPDACLMQSVWGTCLNESNFRTQSSVHI